MPSCTTQEPIGPLHANNGLVAATTSIGVLYGGTGVTTAPSYGQLLLGNSSGGYTLTATSSLGLPTFGYLFPSNGTSTLLSFNGGLLSLASTTIGNGTQTGGLTISGGATTTGNAYFAGNVGIGSTTPAYTLSLPNTGIIYAGGMLIGANPGNTSQHGYITSDQALIVNANSSIILNSSGSSVGIESASGSFRVGTNLSNPSQVFLDVTSTGNVGIGTTSPYAKLSVTNTGTGPSLVVEDSTSPDSTPFIIDASGNVGIGMTTLPAKLSVISANTEGTIDQVFVFDASGNYRNGISNQFSNTAAADNKMFFRIGDTSQTANNTVMTLTGSGPGGSGNVGIGTTSPYAKLSVVGPVVAEYFHATSSAATSTFAGGLSAAGSSGLTVLQDGRVGLGGAPISYGGTYTATVGSTAGVGTLYVGSEIYLGGNLDRIENSGGGSFNFRSGTGGFSFNNGSTNFLRILDTGNVGIGTTSPAAGVDLDLKDNAGGQIRVGDGYTGLSIFGDWPEIFFNAHYNGSGIVYDAPESVFSIEHNQTDEVLNLKYAAVGTAGATVPFANGLTLTQSGTVGIASSTPENAELAIGDKDGNNYSYLVFKNTSAPSGFEIGTEGAAYLWNRDNAAMEFATNNTARMRISADGNVGIGMTNIESRLHLENSGDTRLTVENTAITSQLQLGVDGNGGFLTMNDAHPFVVYTNSAERMRILSGGDVGIGTTSPWRKLSVDGTVSLKNMTAAQAGSVLCLSADNEVTTDSSPASPCSSSLLANKQNVTNLSVGLDAVMGLRPVEFDWRDGFGRGHDLGFIAEEVQVSVPILADYEPDGTLSSVKYTQVGALLTKAIQELASITGTFKANLTAWLADAANGIGDFFARRAHFEEQLCVGDTCVTPEQFAEVFGNQSAVQSAAAGASSGGHTPEAAGGTSAPNSTEPPIIPPPQDTATTTAATSSPSAIPTAANDNEPVEEPPPVELQPANDNPPPDTTSIPATGTD